MGEDVIRLFGEGVVITQEGQVLKGNVEGKKELLENSMAYGILKNHNKSGNMDNLKLTFDALVSPDNNYVSILQTVNACGVKEFPVPYVLSNCHNTLCAVGGTINEDDHVFGLDNVKKFGGIFVPPYKAVIHQYMREMMAGGGKMILGSDSHTRYGVLGTLSVGEGGGEIAKQILSQTYDIKRPPVIAVVLTGKPRKGIGPQDIALTLIGATFKNDFCKNKILEFRGEGIDSLSVEYRMGIDVMTTECGALSSIWKTDDSVEAYLGLHGRKDAYKKVDTLGDTYYDGLIEIDLSKVESMMALPFHPSNVCSINEFKKNPHKYIEEIEAEGMKVKGEGKSEFILRDKLKDGQLHVDQALVSGCSGGLFENIAAMADILRGTMINDNNITLGVNPASQPIYMEMSRHGLLGDLVMSGATVRPCICGPCFGVTDVPANNQLSIRHVTRNYPNRDGSKPGRDQMAAVILMDARSIAATVRNGGVLTAATDLDVDYSTYEYQYDTLYYKNQVVDKFGKCDSTIDIRKGPNIAEWPEIKKVKDHLVLKVAGAYEGSVSTDDLSPSGDAVAYRSNPLKLSEFTMINRDAGYVKNARAVNSENSRLESGEALEDARLKEIVEKIIADKGCSKSDITIGSVIVSNSIGDGSSREQAASSQKILGGYADIAEVYATKRYRSNLINWGIMPIVTADIKSIEAGDCIVITNVEDIIENAGDDFEVEVIGKDRKTLKCNIGAMTEEEKMILLSGCLINYNRNKIS